MGVGASWLVHVQCRRKKSSRSLSHLLMSSRPITADEGQTTKERKGSIPSS